MKYWYLLLVPLLILSCVNSRTILISSDYDLKSNITTFSMLPYEVIKIPGKWYKTEFRKSSNQQFFLDSDSTQLAIGFTTYDKYEFSKPSLTGFEFVTKLYEWDSEYLSTQCKAERKILKENKEKPYILYLLKNETLEKYMLYGYKNKIVYTFVISSKNLKEDEKVNFLKSLFLSVY